MSQFKETLKTHRITEGGVSYYIKKAKELESLEDNKVLFPQSSAIINAFYCPYLLADSFEEGQVSSVDVNIPTVDGVKYQGNVGRLNYLNQTQRNFTINETVNVHENFETSQRTIGGHWKWQNESKCHLYPYSFFMYTDGVNEPLVIYPQFVPTDSSYKITIRQYLNMNGIYQLSLNGYRGDYVGMFHGVQCQGIPIPTAQSSYVDWKIANKYQRFWGVASGFASGATNNMSLNKDKKGNVSLSTTGIGATIGTAIGGPLGGAVGAVVGGLVGSGVDYFMSYQGERDMQNQPNAIINQNADFSFQMQFNMNGDETSSNVNSGLALRQIHYRYRNEDMERIGLMFHKFGTKQNKLINHPDLKSRRYYNYIKCSDTFLNSQEVPQSAKTQILNILANGTTIWHTYNNPDIGNYSLDNPEI